MTPMNAMNTRDDRRAMMAARGAYQVVDQARAALGPTDNLFAGSLFKSPEFKARQRELGTTLTRAAADTFRRSCAVAETSAVATRIADLAIDGGYHTTRQGNPATSGGLYQAAAACTREAAHLPGDWKQVLEAADKAQAAARLAASRHNVAGAVSLYEASAEAFIRASSLAPDSAAAARVAKQAAQAADLAGQGLPMASSIPDATVQALVKAAETATRAIADKPAAPPFWQSR